MPFCNGDNDCLSKLGKALKDKRSPGEQFCVFAFDCAEHGELEPAPSSVGKDDLPLSQAPHNWDGAFYSAVGPAHTEQAVLQGYGQWISDYEGFYGRPTTLYIYSFLIPCLRDGHHGHCSDGIIEVMNWSKEKFGLSKVRIGWSNNDRDADMAHAIKHMMADMEDDGINIEIYPQISIAG
jgi:hypothetical protein